MTLHINEFSAGRLVAAYTATDLPDGQVLCRHGNACLVQCAPDRLAVVSLPRSEGDIMDYIPAGIPIGDLRWAF